jgi:hypothetical protein
VAAFGPTMLFPSNCGSEPARGGGLIADHVVLGVHIRCCGNGGWRFRPYGEALFSNAKKVPKKACPGVRPLAGARCSFVPAFIWGHRLRSASRRPPLDVFDFVERRYAPAPQMNASTQPAEGAGGSKSKAGELPLGLLSGEERGYTSIYCGSWPASEDAPPADQSPADVHRTLWELACRRWRPNSQPCLFGCDPPFKSNSKKNHLAVASLILLISRRSLSSSSLHPPRLL